MAAEDNGLVALGVPIGQPEYVRRKVHERMEIEQQLLNEIPLLPDLQCSRRPKNSQVGCGRTASVLMAYKTLKARTFDPFLHLSVPVTPGETALSSSLEAFAAEEHLSGADMWHCERCAKRVEATKRMELYKLPPVVRAQDPISSQRKHSFWSICFGLS